MYVRMSEVFPYLLSPVTMANLQKDIRKKAPTFREEMNCEKHICIVML
jgi:hypothetical protein